MYTSNALAFRPLRAEMPSECVGYVLERAAALPDDQQDREAAKTERLAKLVGCLLDELVRSRVFKPEHIERVFEYDVIAQED